ncbi:hypothetical protein FE783_29895 [Paenibacillus mesophilus]|uniref:MATE family efflux transporter n=1 Tax=Paenibacillus mesophilus TaxID=2582849 RepID=UPI00110DA950|nr:hypothetical protein FE783_29895 [Paenibacillus mesophilus]
MAKLQYKTKEPVAPAELSASDRKETRRRIVDLAWPAFTEMVLLNLIGMLTMIMVSRVSPNAVAAVALTNQPVGRDCSSSFSIGVYSELGLHWQLIKCFVRACSPFASAVGSGSRTRCDLYRRKLG